MSKHIEPLTGEMLFARQFDGKRRFIRDTVLRYGDEIIILPCGFITNFTSWPRNIPGPAYYKVDYAGAVHDFIYKYKTLGLGGREVSFAEANMIWFEIARAGDDVLRTNLAWSSLGLAGLSVGGWVAWMRYRRKGMNPIECFFDRFDRNGKVVWSEAVDVHAFPMECIA